MFAYFRKNGPTSAASCFGPFVLSSILNGTIESYWKKKQMNIVEFFMSNVSL